MVTPLQQRIYEFIRGYLQAHGYSPSLVDITAGVGISPKSVSLVSRSIHALVAAGRLQYDKKGYRNITLASTKTSFKLPLIGRVEAGVPIEANPVTNNYIDLGRILSSSDHFILEVKGEAMQNDSILDGDYIVCKHPEFAKENDMVIALIDQREVGLKRISFQVPDRITLIPSNLTLKPKAYLANRIQIQGVYVGLLRLRPT